MQNEIRRLPVVPFKRIIKTRAKNWLQRFFPAEISGTIMALAISYTVFSITKNRVAGAYAGSIGETIGFYSTIFIQDLIAEKKKLDDKNKTLSTSMLRRILGNIVFDFGIAEMADSIFLRPLCMYIFPRWLKSYTWGILIGKIASDISFYLPVIISYELRLWFFKKRENNKKSKP